MKPRIESDFTVRFVVEIPLFGHDDERDYRRALTMVTESLTTTFGEGVLVADRDGRFWSFDPSAHSADTAEGGLSKTRRRMRVNGKRP